MIRGVRELDRPSLVAGVVIVALGAVLLLDALGRIALTFAAVAPLTLAVLGAILLASGLARRAR